jgi:hypothetical protein
LKRFTKKKAFEADMVLRQQTFDIHHHQASLPERKRRPGRCSNLVKKMQKQLFQFREDVLVKLAPFVKFWSDGKEEASTQCNNVDRGPHKVSCKA